MGFGQGLSIQLLCQRLNQILVVLDGPVALTLEGIKPHQQAMGALVQGFHSHPFQGILESEFKLPVFLQLQDQAFQCAQIYLSQVLAFSFAPILVQIFQQVTYIERYGCLQLDQTGVWVRIPAEGLYI